MLSEVRGEISSTSPIVHVGTFSRPCCAMHTCMCICVSTEDMMFQAVAFTSHDLGLID